MSRRRCSRWPRATSSCSRRRATTRRWPSTSRSRARACTTSATASTTARRRSQAVKDQGGQVIDEAAAPRFAGDHRGLRPPEGGVRHPHRTRPGVILTSVRAWCLVDLTPRPISRRRSPSSAANGGASAWPTCTGSTRSIRRTSPRCLGRRRRAHRCRLRGRRLPRRPRQLEHLTRNGADWSVSSPRSCVADRAPVRQPWRARRARAGRRVARAARSRRPHDGDARPGDPPTALLAVRRA